MSAANTISELDLKQEGRITALETKVDRIVILTEELHEDMLQRHARRNFLGASGKYVAWLGAGAASILGLTKSESFASWLGSFPH